MTFEVLSTTDCDYFLYDTIRILYICTAKWSDQTRDRRKRVYFTQARIGDRNRKDMTTLVSTEKPATRVQA